MGSRPIRPTSQQSCEDKWEIVRCPETPVMRSGAYDSGVSGTVAARLPSGDPSPMVLGAVRIRQRTQSLPPKSLQDTGEKFGPNPTPSEAQGSFGHLPPGAEDQPLRRRRSPYYRRRARSSGGFRCGVETLASWCPLGSAYRVPIPGAPTGLSLGWPPTITFLSWHLPPRSPSGKSKPGQHKQVPGKVQTRLQTTTSPSTLPSSPGAPRLGLPRQDPNLLLASSSSVAPCLSFSAPKTNSPATFQPAELPQRNDTT